MTEASLFKSCTPQTIMVQIEETDRQCPVEMLKSTRKLFAVDDVYFLPLKNASCMNLAMSSKRVENT